MNTVTLLTNEFIELAVSKVDKPNTHSSVAKSHDQYLKNTTEAI